MTAINPWPSTNLALHSKPQCVRGTPLKLEKSLSTFDQWSVEASVNRQSRAVTFGWSNYMLCLTHVVMCVSN